VSLNRIGMLLNFAAGFLLAPQIIGVRHLHRLEAWLEKGLSAAVTANSRWLTSNPHLISDTSWQIVLLMTPGWFVLARALAHAPSTAFQSWFIEAAAGLGIAIASGCALWVLVYLLMVGFEGLGDLIESDPVPPKPLRSRIGLHLSGVAYYGGAPVIIGAVIGESIVRRLALLSVRLAIRALAPGDRLPSLLVGAGLRCSHVDDHLAKGSQGRIATRRGGSASCLRVYASDTDSQLGGHTTHRHHLRGAPFLLT